MFTTMKKRQTRGRPRLITWVTLLMFLVSLTPAAASIAAGMPAGSQASPQETAQGTEQYLEVHVSVCPPGTELDFGALYNTCHADGAADVPVHITGPETDTTISTVRVNGAGPGIVNTGNVPVGDYTFAADIPGDMNDFFVYCSEADSDTRVTATPDDAATSTVTLAAGVSVICDLYVVPQGGNEPPSDLASISFDVKTCDRADLSDDRTWEELSANCTVVPTPPTAPETPISVSMGMPGGVVNTQPLDAEGKVSFNDLPNGDYPVSTNVDLDKAGQYLFCTYEGQPRYQKTFDNNDATTFTDMQGEDITCDLFVVYAPQDAPPAEELASISLDVLNCPQGYDVATEGEDGATFAANCTNPTADVMMTLTDPAGGTTELTSDAEGSVTFPDLDPGTYTLFSSIPLEAATEYLFCMDPGGVEYQKDFSDRGVTTFQDLEDEQLDCAWYIVTENLRGDETGATVTVHLATCPEDYAGDQFYADCHANGVADLDFTLSGPNGDVTATTTIPADPGPGVATFTKLPPGDYTLAGGPPQDFGSVALYCSDPSTSERIDATMDGGIAHFPVAEQQSILCDWYFIPESGQGESTPPPPAAKKAEILVTLFACDEGEATAGATFSQLDSACDTTVDDVNFSLGVPGGTPLSAATGVSGDGAVRFYDLRPGDYVMTPSLPDGYSSAAVYCQIGNGEVYQKPLQSGSTTFVDVDGEQIACSWFLAPVPKPQPQPTGPTGSITVREFLCEGDRGEIKDWERECVPGTMESAFTLKSSDGAVNLNAKPNDKGVLVFSELPDGYYDLTQDTGVWCKAAAERVDSRSRVIVQNGGNTDVFIYECGQVTNLPTTGSGPDASDLGIMRDASWFLAALAIPAFGAAIWQMRRTRPEPVPVRIDRPQTPASDGDSANRMRFR